MTAFIVRIIILAIVVGAIWLGIRRIWRDWTKQFKAEDTAIHQRDLQERERPDVITLKRGEDGTFRPPDSESR